MAATTMCSRWRIPALVLLGLISGQDAAFAWQTDLSGDGGGGGYVADTAVMPNGDVVGTGALYNTPTSDYDWLVARYNGATGAVVWSVAISGGSGPGMGNDGGNRITVDGNGDVVSAGRILKPDNSGDSDGIVKIDGVTGDVLWQVLVPCGVRGLALDASNDLVVGSCQTNGSDKDFRVFKLNGTTHAIVWDYVEPSATNATAAQVAVDGAGDVLAGKLNTDADGKNSFAAVKLSGLSGVELWTQNVIGGPGVLVAPGTSGCTSPCYAGGPSPGDGAETDIYRINLDAAGNLLIGGSSYTGTRCGECRDRWYDFTVTKIANADGAVVWWKVIDDADYGGFDYRGDAFAVTVNNSGTVFADGKVFERQFLVALDPADGSTLWAKFDVGNYATDIARLANDNIATSYIGDYHGSGESGFASAFSAADGTELWRATRPSYSGPYPYSLAATSDGGLVVGLSLARQATVVKLNGNDGTYSNCGDGVIDSGEECDDGNPSPSADDCCSPSCAFKAAGLHCHGNAGICNGTGVCEFCGNGIVEAGEECDDGNNVNGDCCSSTCQNEPIETPCDTGSPQTNGFCRNGFCVACGNGVVEFGEYCDDGNIANGDCCSSTCHWDPDGTPCDDGLACSTASQCNNGFCRPTAGNCCGDGILQSSMGEVCDDGNTSDNDCCLSNCQANTGASCVYFPTCNPTAQCNALGRCDAGPSVCDCCTTHDGPGCNNRACQDCVNEYAGNCGPTYIWNVSCTYAAHHGCASVCGCSGTGTTTTVTTTTATSTTSTTLCTTVPSTGCRQPTEPGKAALLLRTESTSYSDALKWKWGSGAATAAADFGDPLTTDSYALCIYDESGAPTLLYEMTAAAEPDCVSDIRPCWKGRGNPPLSEGAKYTNTLGRPEGLTGISLKPGADGKANIQVKGAGRHLPFPTVPAAVPVPLRVQLQARNGNCWEAVYPTARVNNGTTFKANSQ